jgi:hypothetical protein
MNLKRLGVSIALVGFLLGAGAGLFYARNNPSEFELSQAEGWAVVAAGDKFLATGVWNTPPKTRRYETAENRKMATLIGIAGAVILGVGIAINVSAKEQGVGPTAIVNDRQRQ